jgi:tetratricopeptide (TPR) repeat protein
MKIISIAIVFGGLVSTKNILPQTTSTETSPWLMGIFFVGALYFGMRLLGVTGILIRLLVALISGAVKWPGPIVHDPNPNVNWGRLQLGLSSDHLFSTFIGNFGGLAGAFVFFLLSFLSATPILADQVHFRWTWILPIVIIVVYLGGETSSRKASYHGNQVKSLLANLSSGEEPRQIEGNSAEAEYAIEHPLVEHHFARSDYARALTLFSEATKYSQAGNQQHAMMLYQQAMEIAPSLHEQAREALSKLAQVCSPKDAGPIYYWLGAHSEYLMDLGQAVVYYGKAIDAFRQMGYRKRESRVHCNLGHVKMLMRDESGVEEFGKAIALNPRNGIAHLNIARLYYSISGPGDDKYERALDAFADAVVADPLVYGPRVIASLRELGYTWKEDLEKITQRVESKQGPSPNKAG